MRRKRYLALLWLCLVLVPCAFGQRAGQGPDALIRFRNALEQDGFDVIPGAAVPVNLAAQWCTNKPGVTSAIYSNNEPYVGLLVPKAAEDPSPVPGDFQLRPDEAVVLIGLTPPPAKYFGFTPYLYSRMYPKERKPIFASLGDSVNKATIKTIGPSPFNAPVVLIFTPDQMTDASVRAALQRAGYPEAIINTVVFPASMLNLGHGDTADELRIALRNAIWLDGYQAAGAAYVNTPPLNVFRVTPSAPATGNPFPAPRLRIRGTGQTEMELMSKLAELRQGIVKAYAGLHPTDIATGATSEGYDYLQRSVNPLADTRDAFYLTAGWVPEFSSEDKITLEDDEFLVLYGANHVAIGKATYMSINVYASETAKLSIGYVDDHQFTGTARPYLPPGDAAAERMYAYKVSRTCGKNEPQCLQLSVDNCPRLTLDSSTLLGIFTRIYLEPATKVGPAMPEILYDRVMKFSPRPPAQQ
jgi:hypothetical protein